MVGLDGSVKLIDFGLSKNYGTPEKKHSNNITTR
jgi:cyclin-dependent kinase 7